MKTKLKGMPLVAEAALMGYLGPKLAADAGINVKKIVSNVTGKSWEKDKAAIKVALDAAVKPGADGKAKLAKDADINDLPEMLNDLTAVAQEVANTIEADQPGTTPPAATDAPPGDNPAGGGDGGDKDMVARVREVLGTMGLSDEQVQTIMAAMKPQVKAEPPAMDDKGNPIPPKKEDDKVKDMVTRPAMDAAIKLGADQAAERARNETMTLMREISQAEKDVAPFVGEVTFAADAMPKSAADVYKLALDAAKVPTAGVPPAAFKAMVGMLPKPDAATGNVPGRRPRVAQDSAAADALAKRFPGLGRIGTAG